MRRSQDDSEYGIRPGTKYASMKVDFYRVSPYLACMALVLIITVGIFTLNNYYLFKSLAATQNQILEDVAAQKAAQTNILIELNKLMAEQQETHQSSLLDLEGEMKKFLAEKLNKLTADQEEIHKLKLLELEERMNKSQSAAQTNFLIELNKLMAEQQETQQFSLLDLEEKMKKSLAEKGYDTAHFSSSTSLQCNGLYLAVLAGSWICYSLVQKFSIP
ncbi:uncharacterized protein LOC108680806 isoform X3 [Hyalella azteca]|uniref:Uncharacterized protein LOC108680806 isoform X3 n=1 Tax=Hyalella azteca TaxID=294128 RepID=A0A8B7PI57_HYAAZ|nr:uncharacterized protein LOC108680806 isoform X3 [Hyalella azteca]